MTFRLIALILASVGVLIGAVILAGVSPAEAIGTLVKGSLGSPYSIGGTLKETMPLLFTGLAVFLALKAGLFNIGVESQFLVGAIAAAGIGGRVHGPGGLVLGAIAGIVAGAVWSLPAGWIRAYRNGHEVISTIMLNNVAIYLTNFLVAGPLRDKTQQSTTTASISPLLPDAMRFGSIGVSSALFAGLGLVGIVWWWLGRTVGGYEFRVVGANPTAARFAGIEPRRMMVMAMVTSGAIAGLGGALEVLAYEGRFYAGFSPGYGFNGLAIALLAGGSALAVAPGAFLFGILAKGGATLDIAGVPKGITTMIIGLVILIASAIRYRKVPPVA